MEKKIAQQLEKLVNRPTPTFGEVYQHRAWLTFYDSLYVPLKSRDFFQRRTNTIACY
jgi:hypothetical protein